MTNNLLSVAALGQQEQHLIVVATTADGVALAEDDPEKLRRLPAANSPSPLWGEGRGEGRDEEKMPSPLNADAQNRKQKLLREINQRNLVYFAQEVEKLDAWADDLKPGLEQEIKAINVEIKEVRRTAGEFTATPTTFQVPLSAPTAVVRLSRRRSEVCRKEVIKQSLGRHTR